MVAVANPEIVGRVSELAALTTFVEGLSEGARGLVLEGPAGVGKTTLWRSGAHEARRRGVRVLEARPVQAEATLAFTGLGDLLGGALDEVLEALPLPQAEALEVALMLRPPPATDVTGQGAVAVATLGALRTLASSGPVVVAVDDIQWLDPPSMSALMFAWRRLRQERVALLATRRVGEPMPGALASDERVVRLPVEPLSLGAVHHLLQSRLGLVLPRPLLLAMYDMAAGNAFYALELGRAMDRREAVPAVGEPLPVPEQLRDLMHERLAALPVQTREPLAAIAALSSPSPRLVAREFGGEEPLRQALQAHVLEVEGDRLRFTHPLLAAAAYEVIDVLSRKALHRRLADLVADSEERARHLALGADGPDGEVAATLERAASQVRLRGATAAAAELCELARRLTPPADVADDLRRALVCGHYRWLAGDTPGAIRLLGEVSDAATGGMRAEALTKLAWVLQLEGDQPRAAELARQALEEPDVPDDIRAEAAERLAMILLFMREEIPAAVRHVREAVAIVERSGAHAVLSRWLSSLHILETMAGEPGAEATARRAAEVDVPADWRGTLGSVAFDRATVWVWTDRHEAAARAFADILDQAIVRGDDGAIPFLLSQLALATYLSGRWSEAERHAEAGYAAAQQAGQRVAQAWTRSTRALVRASLGMEAEARADAADVLALTGPRSMAVARIQSRWALALLELPLERHDRVVDLLSSLREQLQAAGVGEPSTMRFVADEIEALMALDRCDDAEAVLAWLGQRAGTLDRASMKAAAGRCRGLLWAARGDADAALASFAEALNEHERVAMPFERARTLLALGMTHRRAKHWAGARSTLGEAVAVFDSLGATLWAQRARAELRRIGGRAPVGAELTATERRTAELVARGLSNKEAAAALFVTPKTVETQLARIYAKLGIHSRTELARRVSEADGNL